jgi:hypothetical protein
MPFDFMKFNVDQDPNLPESLKVIRLDFLSFYYLK